MVERLIDKEENSFGDDCQLFAARLGKQDNGLGQGPRFIPSCVNDWFCFTRLIIHISMLCSKVSPTAAYFCSMQYENFRHLSTCDSCLFIKIDL